jgi:carboxyl-terminal processing protease
MRKWLLTAIVCVAPALGAQSEPPALASFDTAWSAISRTYFDTVLVQGRWSVTRDSLRAGLGESPSRDQVRGAIRALMAVPAQSHFALIPAEAIPAPGAPSRGGAPGTVGLDLRMIGDTLVVWRVDAGSAAAAVGIRAGDVITHVDTQSIAGLNERLAVVFPRDAKQAHSFVSQMAMSRVRQSTGDTAVLTVQGDRGAPRTVRLAHAPIAGQITRYGNLPPLAVRVTHDSVRVGRGRRSAMIPVIHWSAWFPVVMADLDRALFAARGAPGVILDLRGNPGGVVGMIGGVAGHFTDTIVSLGNMYGRGSTLYLRTNPRLVDPTGTRRPTITGPVAILVDGMSGSATEFFAAGMQATGRARVFGDASAGQALPAATLRLPSGDVMMHPIADAEDANGRRVEGVGVLPDTPAPLTRRALKAGGDPALDAARAWLARTLH